LLAIRCNTGESEAEQTEKIRKIIAAGGWVYDWGYRFRLLRQELEREFGRELPSWKHRDLPDDMPF
jgi:hypothetical protein